MLSDVVDGHRLSAYIAAASPILFGAAYGAGCVSLFG